jgi:hypothetical protein
MRYVRYIYDISRLWCEDSTTGTIVILLPTVLLHLADTLKGTSNIRRWFLWRGYIPQDSCLCVCARARVVCVYKGKGHPRTGHEGPEGEKMYDSIVPSPSFTFLHPRHQISSITAVFTKCELWMYSRNAASVPTTCFVWKLDNLIAIKFGTKSVILVHT